MGRESGALQNRIMQARFLAAVLAASTPFAQSPAPTLRGETLDGRKTTLAEAGAGKATLLVMGFSKKAGDVTNPWRDRFAADFGTNPKVEYFVVAFLEDAPGLVRGMIRSSMRSATPAAQRPHFLVTTSDEAAWKKFTRTTDDKVPSVVLLDSSGQVRWQWNGEFEASHYAALKDAVAALLK